MNLIKWSLDHTLKGLYTHSAKHSGHLLTSLPPVLWRLLCDFGLCSSLHLYYTFTTPSVQQPPSAPSELHQSRCWKHNWSCQSTAEGVCVAGLWESCLGQNWSQPCSGCWQLRRGRWGDTPFIWSRCPSVREKAALLWAAIPLSLFTACRDQDCPPCLPHWQLLLQRALLQRV